MTKILRAFAFAAAVLLASMPIMASASAATQAHVTIDNSTFKPATVSIKIGETVTFTNADDIPHSIVGSEGGFHSKALDTGDSFTFTFKTAGSFGYFCGLHPHMQGRVVVTPQ